MKDFIQTIRNIFRIPELRDRILYTLMLLAVYRFGSFVVLPGIDSSLLQAEFGNQGANGGGVLGLFNSFLGGAFARGSVFALGVMPYISASIVMTLMAAIVPSIQKLRNEGEGGQRKINLYTRYITIVITLFQASSYVVYLRNQYPTATADMVQHLMFFTITSVAVLSAGTMFLVWLGERITDNGIGNGTSLIIMIGIVAGFVPALVNEASASLPLIFFIEIIALGLVTMAVIALTQATRKIAVTYARQITVDSRIQGQLMRGGGGNRSYIPLKVNSTGVMPIIFAQAIMFLPATLVGFLDTNFTAMSALADYTSIA